VLRGFPIIEVRGNRFALVQAAGHSAVGILDQGNVIRRVYHVLLCQIGVLQPAGCVVLTWFRMGTRQFGVIGKLLWLCWRRCLGLWFSGEGG